MINGRAGRGARPPGGGGGGQQAASKRSATGEPSARRARQSAPLLGRRKRADRAAATLPAATRCPQCAAPTRFKWRRSPSRPPEFEPVGRCLLPEHLIEFQSNVSALLGSPQRPPLGLHGLAVGPTIWQPAKLSRPELCSRANFVSERPIWSWSWCLSKWPFWPTVQFICMSAGRRCVGAEGEGKGDGEGEARAAARECCMEFKFGAQPGRECAFDVSIIAVINIKSN